MKLWVLTENTAREEGFRPEHGLSLYLEVNGRKILFDAGQSDAFRDNAARLGVDLTAVDTAVLSHGHYDHGGGLPAFLEENKTAPVYLSALAFGAFCHGPEKYIGLPPSLRGNDRLRLTQGFVDLGDGLELYPAQPGGTPSRGLHIREGDRLSPDTFLHEQYLLIREGEKRILLSGCSHRGIVAIAGAFRPDVLIGGFHLNGLDPRGPELADVGNALAEIPACYYTGHCTGQEQFAALKKVLGARLRSFSTGAVLEI